MAQASGRRPSRGLAWPIGLAVILAISVGANMFVFHLANDDPSFAVEPDYYRKAVQWDDELAQRRRNAELGWRAAATLAAAREGAAGGDAATELRVRLTDSAGAPLDGAAVSVEALAIDRASQVATFTLAAASDPAGGVYSAMLPAARAGRWELRLVATRGGERFTAVERLERAAVERTAVERAP
jgi:nitrogen fixation protein FixH